MTTPESKKTIFKLITSAGRTYSATASVKDDIGVAATFHGLVDEALGANAPRVAVRIAVAKQTARRTLWRKTGWPNDLQFRPERTEYFRDLLLYS